MSDRPPAHDEFPSDAPSADSADFRAAGELLSGKVVVVGMLGFGLLMTAALWLYWEMYTRPFRPLQEAIAAEFEGSQPRVIGGRHKSHTESNPAVLRIIVRVDFDPTGGGSPRAEQYAARLRELAGQHVDLAEYELLEVHLRQRIPEQQARERVIETPIKERRGQWRRTRGR